jgi:hypothetical protein
MRSERKVCQSISTKIKKSNESKEEEEEEVNHGRLRQTTVFVSPPLFNP